MPYGEEITGLGNRTVNENYTSDDVRQGFTGYEKDYETGLDFAQARIYQNRLGRFYSSDPLLSSGYLSNPQSWGRYAYAQNNPLNLTDPSGLFVWDDTLGGSASDTELMETSDGRRIVAKRNEIRNALTRAADEAARAVLNGTLTSQQGAEIFDALAAYGAEGTDNGVIVRLGKVKDGDASAGWQEDKDGNATPFRMDKKTGKATALVYVTFESDKINARNAAHEGSHVYDRQLLAMSLDDPSKAHISPTDREENITRYETERRAYQVTSYLDQGMRTDSNVWQRGWSEADRKQGIDRHIKTAAKVSPPGTTPGPGKRLYEPKLSK